MITYKISTCQLWIDDTLQKGNQFTPYSGHGVDINAPDEVSVSNNGPVPPGIWGIVWETYHPHLGALVAKLTPIDVPNLYDRFGFFIHGDNNLRNHSASDGCIIMDLPMRQAIQNSKQTVLKVIP